MGILIDICDLFKTNAEREYISELRKEGLSLEKKAVTKLNQRICPKGTNEEKCNYILIDKEKEHIPGWDYEITGEYECIKCKDIRYEIIQYCN